MKLFGSWFLVSTFWICGARADFTKQQAFALLKQNGFKWKQIESLLLEAKGQTKQANSALNLHLQVASREYIGRINQIQFGFPDPGPLNMISLGATTLQFELGLLDFASRERLKAAEENEKMVVENSKSLQTEVTHGMLLLFLNTQRLRKKMESIDLSIKRNEDIVQIAKARLKMGQGVRADLLRAQSLVEKDNLRKHDTNTAYLKSKQDLAELLGQEKLDEELEPLAIKVRISEKDMQLDLSNTNRPDIQSAGLGVAALGYLKSQTDKEFLPRLLVAGDVGVMGTHVLGGVGNALSGSVGIQLSMPILDGGYLTGKAEEASAKLQKAQYRFEEIKLQAKSQIKMALQQLKDAEAALDASAHFKNLATEELSLMQKKFASGVSSGIELSNSQVNFANAIDIDTDAAFGYEAAKINFYKVKGDLLDRLTKDGGSL